jgi:hypothetical protein
MLAGQVTKTTSTHELNLCGSSIPDLKAPPHFRRQGSPLYGDTFQQIGTNAYLCLFPTQCIARYTEGLYEVQGNTKHARASEPSLAQSLMRLLVAVAVRNLRSSTPFPSTRWSTAQGYFYCDPNGSHSTYQQEQPPLVSETIVTGENRRNKHNAHQQRMGGPPPQSAS